MVKINEEKDNLWELSMLDIYNGSPCKNNGRVACNCAYSGKCIRKDIHSDTIGVCWMERGQGEY